MPEFIGPIAIPDPGASGTFPITLDYSSVQVREPRVVVHQFGTLDAKVEQRFYEGPGVRRFQVQMTRLTPARRAALVEFFEARRGSYQPFTLNIAEPDGSIASHSARFAQPSLQLDASADGSWRGTVELLEVPTTTPSYIIASTETRFPGAALKSALLSQTQEVIPLVRISAGAYTLALSDRRVTVDGTLHQPRLLSWGGISQGINGEADQASFTFGNGDRLFTALVNQVDLFKAHIEFSVFHVGTGIRLDLWKGFVGSWAFDGGPEFRVEAHDGLYALRLGYPARKIVRQDEDPRRAFDIPNQPVNVGGKKGISRITSVSVANDTAYGRGLKDIWANTATALPVECDVIAGRDESEFYAALGVVGRGPISGFGSGHTLDGQPNHGPGSLGLRRAYGGTPATGDETAANNQPDTGSDSFALDEVGQPLPASPLDGVAFLQIRRTDEKGIQPVRSEERRMTAFVTGGLGGWSWTGTGPYSRNWQSSLTNPIWIAVNTYLNGLGLLWVADAAQQAVFDVASAVAAAAVCDASVTKIIGTGTERQFAFQGTVAEEKPLRDWVQEILGSCLGYYTLAFGKLKLGLRYNSSAVEAFSLGNILFNSLQLASRSPRFNDLTVAFPDEDYGYQQNTVNWKDSDHIAATGLPLKANVNLLGVTGKSQAARIATIKGREELGGLTAAEQLAARRVQFRTTILALNVEPGMVCSMTSADMPGGAGELRVTSWQLNPDWSIDVAGETTCDSMYDLTVGEKPTDVTPEPLPERVAYDLLPGDATNVEALAPVDEQLKLIVPVRFTPPSPRGSFQSVVAYLRMPEDASQGVFAGRHSVDWDLLDENGCYTISIDVPKPFDADTTAIIYLVSASAFYERRLDLVNTPHTGSIDVPKTTPLGETPIADVTNLQVVGATIGDDGNVTLDVAAACPTDAGFAGCEMFLEIPAEADPDPEHPTMPGQIYHQGWWYAEPNGSLSGQLIVPVPPLVYLQGLARGKLTWVVYALSRSWGYTNELVRLTTLSPMAPAEHTPAVACTPDFNAYLAGATADDGLGSVTLSGQPTVASDESGISIAQDYAPPYFGIPGAFSIGSFEGVAVMVECPDGSTVDCGSHPYTKDWQANPPGNIETLQVSAPMPASLPATLYLHMMSYSNNDRQKFKQVLHGGVPTVHSQYAIATVTVTAESVAMTAPTIASTLVETRNVPGEGWSYRLQVTLSGGFASHPNYEGTTVFFKDSADAMPPSNDAWRSLRQVASHSKGDPSLVVYSDWHQINAGTNETAYVKAVATENGGSNPQWSGTYGPFSIAIPKDSIRDDKGHNYNFSVTLNGYHEDGNKNLMAKLDVAFAPLSGSGYEYAIWEYFGDNPPADPALWQPTDVAFPGSGGTMWAALPETGTVTIWYALVANNADAGLWRTPADYITDAVATAHVALSARGLSDQVTNFSVTVQRDEAQDVPRAYFSFDFTVPADPDFNFVRFFRRPADVNGTPAGEYLADPVCGLRSPGRQDGDWPIPSAEYWIFKAVAYNALEEPNEDNPPTCFVAISGSANGVKASRMASSAVAAGSPVSVDANGKLAILNGAILSEHIDELDVGKLNGLIQAGQIQALNANQINGSITAEQIGSVSASSITGQINAGQIASINANQISGSIQAAQIATVNASAINGSILAGQIQSLAATQITGVVVTSQLADGIMNTARLLGSNLQVPVAVSALPTLPHADYPVGTLVLRTTDKTLWENQAGAWSATTASAAVSGQIAAADIVSVNSSSLVGLITAGQISSITANQITGTISSDKISSIEASKITGSISSSQIASIDAGKISGTIQANQIGSVAANQITGQISSSQIQSIEATKISGSISASQIASINATNISGTIVANQIGSVNASVVSISSTNQFPAIWTSGGVTAVGSIYSDNGDVVATSGTLRGANLHLTGSSYTIADPAAFRSAIGAAAAGSGSSVNWSDIAGKPTTFPPEAHTHDYAPTSHTHSGYAASNHSHSVNVALGWSVGEVVDYYGSSHWFVTDLWVSSVTVT